MTIQSDSPGEALGRQRDPEPPSQIPAPSPSFLLYVLLLFLAIVLLFSALTSGTQNWPSFFLNLASEIVGAVIILVVVERRFRSSELRVIQRVPQTTKLYLATLLFRDVRQIIGFVRVLSAQMKAVSKPYHLPRPQIEAVLTAKLQDGFVMFGEPGTGKTALVHRLVWSQATGAMREPRRARIPILISVHRWSEGDAKDALLESMQSFYPVSVRTFNHLLQKGRLLCVFDGIDEAFRPPERVQAIKEFRHQYPRNAVILSCRNCSDELLGDLDLPRLQIPPLTKEEVERILELRKRFS